MTDRGSEGEREGLTHFDFFFKTNKVEISRLL
jgi:hypothetical protein